MKFNEMRMLGPNMSYLPKMYYFFYFFLYQSGEFIQPTFIRLLAPDVSRWQAYFTYSSFKFLCKDLIDKMHEILILDVCFNVWS